MSLDMTVGARETALDSNDDEIEAQTAVTPVWLVDLMMLGATAASVMLCSALGVLLFLR